VIEKRRLLVAENDITKALASLAVRGASDLHVISDATPRIRIDGRLQNLPDAGVWTHEVVEELVHSLLRPEQLEKFNRMLELDFSFTLPDLARFRVNLYQQQGLLGAAFRVIPKDVPSLQVLGVPSVIEDFTKLPRGLVLVTGPTGSGKSTTLAAMIEVINASRAVHIMTVEDPIEFTHAAKLAMVNQREVGTDTLSFASALRHVLRQDPDVILIGELRDHDTISAALTAAETGHLVFATLHTQDAPQTIDRIVDVFPADQQDQVRIQLAMTLKGIVSQVLLPRIGKGRVLASEILLVTPAVENLIRENKVFQIPSVLASGRAQGMHTLDQSLAALVHDGVVEVKSAYEVARDRDELTRLLGFEKSNMNASDSNFGGGIVPKKPRGF
jgi:twitching motility protein PilT